MLPRYSFCCVSLSTFACSIEQKFLITVYSYKWPTSWRSTWKPKDGVSYCSDDYNTEAVANSIERLSSSVFWSVQNRGCWRIPLKDGVPYCSDHNKTEAVENSAERLSSWLLWSLQNKGCREFYWKIKFLTVLIIVKQRLSRIPLKDWVPCCYDHWKTEVLRVALKDGVLCCSDQCETEVVENSTERSSSFLLWSLQNKGCQEFYWKIKFLTVLIIVKQNLSRIPVKDWVPCCCDQWKTEVVESSTKRWSSLLLWSMWNRGGWEFHWKIKLLSVLIMTKQWLSRIYHMTQIHLHMQSPDYSCSGMKFGKQKEGC